MTRKERILVNQIMIEMNIISELGEGLQRETNLEQVEAFIADILKHHNRTCGLLNQMLPKKNLR